jgi:uncharacterized protein with HEPN domain
MKAVKDYSDYLNDIVEYAAKAESFLVGVSLEDFKTNEEKTLAVIRALEVIGEAARNLPKQIRKKYPEVPWDEMTGMRNKLIHDYFGVNIEVVWRTVKEDLPSMSEAVMEMIQALKVQKP